MRRLFIAATVCAAVLLPAAAAFAAPPGHAGDGHHSARVTAGSAAVSVDDFAGTRARFAPLAARLNAGSATIKGTVRRSDSSPISNAYMEWWGQADSQEWYWGETRTDSSGRYSMAAMPTGNGEVYATYPDDRTTLGFQSQQWADAETKVVDFFPGRVSAGATLGGDWADDFEYLAVRLWGNDRYSRGEVPADGTATPEGAFDVNAGTYYWGSAKFFYDEGAEFEGTINVSSGAQSGASVAADEASAQRVYMTAPFWDSGKPGATVRIVRENFPAGWDNSVSGYDDAPDAAASSADFGTRTSSGAITQSLRVRVPSSAKPGYSYWIGFQHTNGIRTLYLETPYQVATMKASKTAVRRGARIRVAGVVPTAGHWDDTRGLRKVVTLYAHRGTAPVPTKWNPKSQGWVRVCSVRTNGLGAYSTPYFKPLKTLTLVVRYPGDDWYFGAYTSARRITVR